MFVHDPVRPFAILILLCGYLKSHIHADMANIGIAGTHCPSNRFFTATNKSNPNLASAGVLYCFNFLNVLTSSPLHRTKQRQSPHGIARTQCHVICHACRCLSDGLGTEEATNTP